MTDETPREYLEYADLKAQSFNPRRNASKTQTPEQVHAKALLECRSRHTEVKARCEGIADDDAKQIVMRCMGKPLRELFNQTDQFNRMRYLLLEQAHAIAQADMRNAQSNAKVLQAANEQVMHAVTQISTQTQALFERMMDKIDHLSIAGPEKVAIADQRPNGNGQHE